MSGIEDPRLELARRHVAEAETRIAAQTLLIARMEADGHSTELAGQLLAAMRDSLDQMRRHRDLLEGRPSAV